MARISQLSPSLVNRIAAGEVIERPAAVVKELVENSLDAGAANILIDIEDGGRELIRVVDDGSGIAAADLPLAFASHATSKLLCDDDLFRIRTMGFRGEALASIGSVSHARILSRETGQDLGYEIFNHGGSVSDPQAAAANTGTVIEVRNLFFNVPARRKFIKGASTEFGHITDMVCRLALPHPAVSFRVTHNGRKTLDLPAATATDRLLCGWPDDFRDSRLVVDTRDAEIRLTGIVGLPELARPVGKYQYLYLNGRHIRDKFMQHALREAYRGLTEPGRYPAAILLLEMPAADVDVNVHPTKTEVRFRDGGRIHGLVLSGVREKLLGSDLTPMAVPVRADQSPSLPREDLQQRLAAFFRQGPDRVAETFNPPTASVNQTPSAGFAARAVGLDLLPPIAPANSFTQMPTAPEHSMATVESTATAEPTLPSGQAFASGSILPATAESVSSVTGSTSQAPHPSPAPAETPVEADRFIQLHNSYLVAESADGMIIIDQHALHERIMYEELLTRLTRGPLEAQRLLLPQVIPASGRQIALLETVRPLLEKLGIESQVFGPDSVAVHSFPSFLHKLDPGDFVREILDRGEQELLDLTQEELLHEILDMMACKAAVKAGDPLTPAEIQALLSRRELVERSSNCPHGRPTTLLLSLRDLDKQFKRTGF